MSGVWLLTDYGLDDPWVGIVKAVIERTAPGTSVTDLTHSIPPGDVAQGATRLRDCAGWLPGASVVMAVVDPGVGGPRRAVAVRTADGPTLIGPDNGLLAWACDRLGSADEAVEISNSPWLPGDPSATFHGRDVFAPVAARLAAGANLADAGDRLDPASLVTLPEPLATIEQRSVTAVVAIIDRYGNLSLAAGADECAELLARDREVSVTVAGRTHSASVARTFSGVPAGHPLVHSDADGRLAIAVNGGSAAKLMAAEVGSVVTVEWDR